MYCLTLIFIFCEAHSVQDHIILSFMWYSNLSNKCCYYSSPRVADQRHFDASPNPDPASHFDADPDSAFHFYADLHPDPDPTFHFDADPDPS
jgi:hypothetical protein